MRLGRRFEAVDEESVRRVAGPQPGWALKPSAAPGAAINCGDGSMSLKGCLIDISLTCSTGKWYGFSGFGVFQEVFREESDLKLQFGCIAHNVMHYSG